MLEIAAETHTHRQDAGIFSHNKANIMQSRMHLIPVNDITSSTDIISRAVALTNYNNEIISCKKSVYHVEKMFL